MAADCWPPTPGRRLVTADCWPPTTGRPQMAAPHTISRPIVAACFWPRTTGRRWPPPVCRLLFATSYWPCTTGGLLLAAVHPLARTIARQPTCRHPLANEPALASFASRPASAALGAASAISPCTKAWMPHSMGPEDMAPGARGAGRARTLARPQSAPRGRAPPGAAPPLGPACDGAAGAAGACRPPNCDRGLAAAVRLLPSAPLPPSPTHHPRCPTNAALIEHD